MYSSTNEALEILDNPKNNPLDREEAIHHLAADDSPNILARLVAALDDEHFGVRWAAAVALANKGDTALPYVLQGLTVHNSSNWMREGVHHVLHYNSSRKVRESSVDLMKALKGPGADLAAAIAAGKLLSELRAQ